MEIPGKTDGSKYWKPSLTTDVVLISGHEKARRHVLLIRRKNPPYRGCWAFPGGFLDEGETLKQCAVRELEEETGVKLDQDRLRLLLVADDPERDSRSRVISVVYLAEGRREEFSPEAASDADEVRWFPLDDLPPLAFDHPWIIEEAKRLLFLL